MKRIFLFIGAVFFAVAGVLVAKKLPADNSKLIEKKYAGWSGVIRIWAEEECGAGSWLNACAETFERSHPGIYINVQELPGETISAYATSGVNPPDILIYNSGVLSDTSLLSPIAAAYPLRDGIRQEAYAVPVLLRPRFWIYDPTVYEALPGDMYEVRSACSADDIFALVALCTGLRPAEGAAAALPGIDIGLTGDTEATPAPTGGVACRVSPDIITDQSPRKLFSDGDISAFIGGVGDVLRLDDCAAAATGDYAYASGIVMCSIISKDDGRLGICREYLDTLMGEGQALAARAQAFPAVSGASAWEGDRVLGSVEEGLRGKIWLAGTYDASAAYSYIDGNISADEAAARLLNIAITP